MNEEVKGRGDKKARTRNVRIIWRNRLNAKRRSVLTQSRASTSYWVRRVVRLARRKQPLRIAPLLDRRAARHESIIGFSTSRRTSGTAIPEPTQTSGDKDPHDWLHPPWSAGCSNGGSFQIPGPTQKSRSMLQSPMSRQGNQMAVGVK